jgi:hypothetical protein
LAAFGIKTKLNENQRNVLTSFYSKNKYPTSEEREQLAQKIGCPLNQVYWWFIKARQKETKMSLSH